MYKLLILTLLFPFFAFSNVNLNAICTSNDNEQRAISDIISKTMCDTMCDSWYTYSSDIHQYYNDMNSAYNSLGSKGWTRKELNFLGYHIIFSNNRRSNRRIQNFIFYINEGSIRSTKPINRSELLDYVNQFRPSRNKLTSLEEPTYSGCENLFNISPTNSAQTEESTTEAGESIVQTEESTTEAGTECLECQIDQLNSAIDQLGEQIASLQSRLEQIKPEEITCTHDKDGSSFNVRVGSSFDCPQVDPYNCQGCQLSYFGNTHDIMVITYACSDGPNPSAHRNLILSEPTAGAGFTAPMFEPPSKLGITCKKAETTSTQNQNSGNSPSNR